ncbi:MAG: alkaline phosphatase family protein [Candidatus Nanoarchaeia archaeon]
MKGILVILDGLGDLPNKQLRNKTPLEVANTPNLDFFASRGEMGWMYPIRPQYVPGSDESLVSIFGNDLISSTRGQLEAIGAGLDLNKGDLALRVNFATIDSLKKGNLLDRRAGRTLTTAEALILSKAINSKVKLSCKFILKPTIQHRAVLVFRGGFSDDIKGNDPHPPTGKIRLCKVTNDEENSQYTVNVLNEFLTKAHGVLNNHPVNESRKNRGLMSANYLLVRGPGTEEPKLKQYPHWLSPSYMPTEIGFSRASGMKTLVFSYPKLKKLDAYSNLYDGLRKACKFSIKSLKRYHKKFNYTYIHIKETDLPGHDNKPLEKKEMLEYIDKTLINFLRKFAPPKGIKVVVTGDHSTPCKLKSHSADPVPVLFYDNSNLREKKFNEEEARKGTFGKILGKELLKKVGFVR